MKKICIWTAGLALALGLASCAKDQQVLGEPQAKGTTLSFTIKGATSPTTYATVAASAGEQQLSSLTIYAYDKATGDFLGQLAETTDYSTSTSGAITTITAAPAWVAAHAGKELNFYFVGNGAGATLNTASEATLVEGLSALQATTSGKAALLATPLLMSGQAQAVRLLGAVSQAVPLKRRVARFDVMNTNPGATTIKAIYVGNAAIQGYVFGTATGGATLAKATLEKIDATNYNYTTDNTHSSAFYLYPTQLGAGATELVVEAEFAGQTNLYSVGSTTAIEANKRYVLKVDAASATFTVEVVDWDEGDTIAVIPNQDDTGFSTFTTTVDATLAANWDEASSIYRFDNNESGSMQVVVGSNMGTVAKVIYTVGNAADVTFAVPAPTSVTTYSGVQVTDTYSFSVPTSSVAGSVVIRLEICARNGNAKKVLTFTKGIVKVADVIKNNPKLVEAIESLLGKGAGEEIDLADLQGITSLDLSGRTDITSLEGIEMLPRLKELNVLDNPNITEVDLSGNVELTSVNLAGTSVTDLDLSNNAKLKEVNLRYGHGELKSLDLSANTELTFLDASGLALESIDLSNNTKLEFASLGGNETLKSVDFSNNINLKKVYLDKSTNISSVEFKNHPNLTLVHVAYSNIETVDVSGALNLGEIRINESSVKHLDLGVNNQLDAVYAHNTSQLETIILPSNSITLRAIFLDNTTMKSLDISKNQSIKVLVCQNNGAFALTVWPEFNRVSPGYSIASPKFSGTTVTYLP